MDEEKKTVAEVADKLATLKGWGGILPGKEVFVTPPVFKEAFPNERDKWPVFKVKPSDGLEFNQDIDNRDLYTIEGTRVKMNQGQFRIAKMRRSVLDWKNHMDGDKAIPCTRDDKGLTDDAIRSLPNNLQDWLLGVISSVDSVSQEESDGLKF